VRDRIADTYLRRELHGDQRLDPADLAAEVGTTTTIARQWLASLRHQQQDGGVLVEPVSHGRPTPEQLAGLRAHFAAGGHQQVAVTGRPADPERLAAEVERHYWTREVRAGQRLRPSQLARELGGDQWQIGQQLAELCAGPATASERIAQLWHAQQQDPTARPLSSSRLAWRLGVADSYVRHVTLAAPQPRRAGAAGRAAGRNRQQLASSPPPVERVAGERDWRLDAACATWTRSCSSPNPARSPGRPGQGGLRRLRGPGAVPAGGAARPPGPRRPRWDLRRRHRPSARGAARPRLDGRGHPFPAGPGDGRGGA
jgi:hypothetical protein